MADLIARGLAKNLLSKVMVNIQDFNADATGTLNSTSALSQAIAYANTMNNVSSLPVPILLPPGTYRVNKAADMAIPSLICVGGVATIVVEDAYAFTISSNFTMSNIKIVSKNTYSKTDAVFKPVFKATASVENVSFNNVVFDSELSAMDGTVRASQCVNLKAVTNLTLNEVVVKGYRHGFTADGLSNNIKGNQLHFENVELPLYVRGSSPSVTDENYAKNIQFSNVSHINTKDQGLNYYKQAGSDTFLMEKCDGITINNVYSEWPVERTAYFSCCRNATVSAWNLKNALGVKFVGGSNTAIPVEIIAANCHVQDVHVVIDDSSMTQQAYIAEFYWAKNWTVKSSTIYGNGIASVAVSTRHYIENGLVEDCYAENLKRGFFEYSYVGNIDNPDPTPDILAGNYTAGVKGLTIRKNTVKNSSTIEYDVIKLQDSAPPAAGTYRYEDITIANNRINNISESFGIASANMACKGIINIDSVKNLRIEDNRINGYYRTDANGNPISLPFQVGSNSKNVTIKHKETVRNQDHKYVWGTLYMSSDSEITISTVSRLMSYHDVAVITVKHDVTDLQTTKDISTSFRIKGTTNFSDTTDVALPVIGGSLSAYTLPSVFGTVSISVDTGDIGTYLISKAGAVTIKADSTALFVASTTDNKFAFFKDGSLPRYLMRYKGVNGVATSFIINYSVNAV